MSKLIDIATNHLPLWLIGIILDAVFLGACELGLLIGRRVVRSNRENVGADNGALGYIVTAIFALLAFMLATTFSMALTRYDTRRLALANEVEAIGTAYLRASLLDEPASTHIRALLRQYARCRVNDPDWTSAEFEAQVARCKSIGHALWSETRTAVQPVRTTALASSTINPINDVLNSAARREIAGRAVIPARVLGVLLICTIAAAGALGSVFAGSTYRFRGSTILLLTLYAICFVLIIDIDRSRTGTVAVSQQPMQALVAELEAQGP